MLTEKIALVFCFLLLYQAFVVVDGRHTDSGSDEEDEGRGRPKEKLRKSRKPSRWSSEEDSSARRRSSRGNKRKDVDDSWGPKDDSWEDNKEDQRGLFDIALKVLDSFLVSSQNRLKQAREREEKQKIKMAEEAARRAALQAAGLLIPALKKPKNSTPLEVGGIASLLESPKMNNSEDHLLAAIKKAASKAVSSKENIQSIGRSSSSGNSSKSSSAEKTESESGEKMVAAVKDEYKEESEKKVESKKKKDQKRKSKGGSSEEDKGSGEGKKKGSKKGRERSKSGEEECDCHSRESMLRSVGHKSSELALDALERVSSRLGSVVTNLINAPRSRGSRESGEKE